MAKSDQISSKINKKSKISINVICHLIQLSMITYLLIQINIIKSKKNIDEIKDEYASILHEHDFSPIDHIHNNQNEHKYADIDHEHKIKADHIHSADEISYKSFRTLDKVLNDLEFHNHWAEEIMYQSVIYGLSGRTVQEALSDAARYNHTHKVSDLKY
tara:strand:- start:326 stop:802 length:477 start_codon:yes stop_codon:yes gene_type:complete